jgi:hypothetical protein
MKAHLATRPGLLAYQIHLIVAETFNTNKSHFVSSNTPQTGVPRLQCEFYRVKDKLFQVTGYMQHFTDNK